MGKAAKVSLPDPLNQLAPAPDSGAGATDDLLSQLAGDEIDRMLAEAEVDLPPEPETPARSGSGAPATGADASAGALDAILSDAATGDAAMVALAALDEAKGHASSLEEDLRSLDATHTSDAPDAAAANVRAPSGVDSATVKAADPLDAELDALFAELSTPEAPSTGGAVAVAVAKAEVTNAPAPADPDAIAPTTPLPKAEPATVAGVDAELDALFEQLNAPTPEATPGQPLEPPAPIVPAVTPRATSTAAVAAAPTAESIDSELDDLFKQLTSADGDVATALAATGSPAPGEEPVPPAASTDGAETHAQPNSDAEPDADTARAERAGLGLDATVSELKSGPDERLAATARPDFDSPHAPAPLPLILRPFEWLSAPLAGASEGARDFVGKAAIVTLINAAAVIVYVTFFRQAG